MTNSTQTSLDQEHEIELGSLLAYESVEALKNYIWAEIQSWCPGTNLRVRDRRAAAQRIINTLKSPRYRDQRRFMLLGLSTAEAAEQTALFRAVAQQQKAKNGRTVDYRAFADAAENVVKQYANTTYHAARADEQEVFTPSWLVREMLDELPEDVWSNPDLKWLDPCAGAGTYMVQVLVRLMDGLANWEPNEKRRYKHILENMIHQCDIQAATLLLNMFTLEPHDGRVNLNMHLGSFMDESFAEAMDSWGVEKFDVVIGNPPYNYPRVGETSNEPFYHKFVLRGLELVSSGGHVSMITPSKWMALDSGVKNYAEKLREEKCIVRLKQFENCMDVFPKQKMTDSVAYLMLRKDADADRFSFTSAAKVDGDWREWHATQILGPKGQLFLKDAVACSVVQKILELSKGIKVSSQTPYGLLTSHFYKAWTGPGTGETYRCFGFNQSADRLDRRGRVVDRVPKEDVDDRLRFTGQSCSGTMDQYKIFFPEALGGPANPKVLGEPIMGMPGDVCTQTFLVTNPCDTQEEATNFLRYMSTRVFRFLVKSFKTSKHCKASLFQQVPVLDMSRAWTDELLYKEFNLSASEIEHIEATVTDPAEWLENIKDPGTREALGMPALTDSDN